jgi:dolichol-phosphate mannosyltransferase
MMKTGVLDRMTSSGYAYLEEILFRCRSAGMTMGEVPYTFEERRGGKSKISAREAAGALWTMFCLLVGRITRAGARKP